MPVTSRQRLVLPERCKIFRNTRLQEACCMYLRFLEGAALLLALVLPAFARDLRVCADPDNLPFSNAKQQGFENQIAQLVARGLNAHLEYQWQRMGRGFVREYLNRGRCELL